MSSFWKSYGRITKWYNQNDELVYLLIITLILSSFVPFIQTVGETSINFYDRLSNITVTLLGFVITSYAIFISFISKLKEKLDKMDILNQLNHYFLLGIVLLFLTNVVYIICPIFKPQDHFFLRFLYFFTFGVNALVVRYLFKCSKKFIE